MPSSPLTPLAFDPAGLSATRDLLRLIDATPNRLLGQNFLVNPGALDKIVAAAELEPADRVLEIGSGLGALSVRLLRAGTFLTAIEKDSRFAAFLEQQLLGQGCTMVTGDALDVTWDQLGLPEQGVKVVANLPYSVSKPVLRRLLEEWRPHLHSLTILVQREVAARLVAKPDTSDYGPLSVMCSLWGEPKKCFDISPGSFFPPPEITSTVVHIPLRTEPAVELEDESAFWRLVRAAFGQRRKQLLNTLLAVASRPQLDRAFSDTGIDGRRRGETLSLGEFAALSSALLRDS